MQPGQMPCPSCETVIALPVESIIAGKPIVCEGCGLQLKANTEQCQPAIDALERWYEETREAREQAGAGKAAGESRRARRPRR